MIFKDQWPCWRNFFMGFGFLYLEQYLESVWPNEWWDGPTTGLLWVLAVIAFICVFGEASKLNSNKKLNDK